jgi:dihydrofolate reductase
MRKLIYTINLSVDGCCDHTVGAPAEDVFDFYINLLRESGLLVYGRITYELMVPYWPDIAKNPAGETKADIEFAEAFVSISKVVFSQSLGEVEDKNTRVVRTKPEDEIIKLKQQEGKNMLIGGVALASHLIKLGLVDEYIFLVMPLLAGEGRRLMDNISLQKSLQLNLVDTRVFKSGSVIHRYVNA